MERDARQDGRDGPSDGSRSAFVTGAASGIGAALVTTLTDRGWRVAGLDLQESAAELSVVGDVTDADGLVDAVQRAGQALGPPDLLVTAAGVFDQAAFADITPAEFQRMLAIHLGGTVNACRAVLPGMLERRSGCIVAITSELALAGSERSAHYAAAKGAILGLVRSLAAEVAADGVRVNSVAPGPTRTPMLDRHPEYQDPAYAASLPLRRLVSPQEVAETVLFLATEGTFFTGQTLSPNAGTVI